MSDITDRARELGLVVVNSFGAHDSNWPHAVDDITDILAAALQRERDEEERAEPSPGYFEMYANEKARAEKAEAQIDTLTKLRALDYTSMVASNARAEKAEGEAKELREALEISRGFLTVTIGDSNPLAKDVLSKIDAALQSQGE
jgi:hypothetical protein